jgi:hypothetical protein
MNRASVCKYFIIVPYSMEKSILSIVGPEYANVNKESIDIYESVEFIPHNKLTEMGYKMKNKRSMAITRHKVKLGFPFTLRIENFSTSYEYDSENKILYFIHKPYFSESLYKKLLESKELKTKSKVVGDNFEIYYVLFVYFVQRFEYLDEEHCLYTSTHLVNTAGWADAIGDNIFKGLIKKVGSSLKKNFITNIKKKIEKLGKLKFNFQETFQ